jgi:hypothetical protein
MNPGAGCLKLRVIRMCSAAAGTSCRALRAAVRVGAGSLLLASVPAWGERIVFSGGQTLDGAVAGANQTSVTFANPFAGLVTIPWADVQSLEVVNKLITPARGCTANCPPANVPFTGVIAVGPGPTLIIPPPYPTSPVRVVDVAAIRPPSSNCPGGLGGASGLVDFKIAASILSATQHQQTYNGEAKFVENWASRACGWPHQRTLIQATPSYDSKKTNKPPANITRAYEFDFQHLAFLNNNRVWAAFNLALYHNNSLGIYLQQSYGLGMGVLLGPGSRPVELGADLRFVGEHFYSPGRSVGFLGARFLELYTVPLDFIRPGTRLVESLRYIPALTESKAWMLRGRVDLLIPISARWAFSATPVYDDYLRNAPYTFRRNYFKTQIGLQFSPAGK